MLIDAFTSARHLFLSLVNSIQSIPHIPLPEDPSLFYSPISSLVSQVVSFPQVSSQITVYASTLAYRVTRQNNLIFLDLIIRNIEWGYRSLSNPLFIFSTPNYPLLLAPNILLQNLDSFLPPYFNHYSSNLKAPGDLCLYNLDIFVSPLMALDSGISVYVDVIRR